jgi:hypothetical protein
MHFIAQHRKVIFFCFGILTLLHILNIFVFKNFYTTDFSNFKLWLLILPALFSFSLFIVLCFEYTIRKRKGLIRIVELSFLSVLSVALLFISIMFLWHF